MSSFWKCEWCGKPLSEADRLRFEVSQLDFERGDGWRSVLDPANTIEEPLLTCDQCRQSILKNNQELAAEYEEYERRRAANARLVWRLLVTMGVLWLFAIFGGCLLERNRRPANGPRL